MLRNVKNLQKYRVVANNGPIGRVDRFYFDDQQWAIRYLVVDTGNWLPGRRVLIWPSCIRGVDCNAGSILLSITKRMVQSSPDMDTHKPVSRQQKAANVGYHGWWYWGAAGLCGPVLYPVGESTGEAADAQGRVETELVEARANGDSHLRSTREVIGYRLQATDGELGHVEDFLVEDDSWVIRYIVVDTSNWWFGRKVRISPGWIREVSWSQGKVFSELARHSIKKARA